MIERVNPVVISLAETSNLQSAVGNYLIGVHVGGGSRATLYSIYRKLGIPKPVAHLDRSLDDWVGNFLRDNAELKVCLSGGLFDKTKPSHQ